jgi:hypothetical protein
MVPSIENNGWKSQHVSSSAKFADGKAQEDIIQ